jgi:heme-degrading monooxygenase HmoA
MIKRIWRGWTNAGNADAYEALLKSEIFPGIAARNVAGYRGIELLRRTLPDGDIEFMTIMTFDSLDAVRAFAGEDYETAYVPAAARAVLARFDIRSAHFDVRKPFGE